MAPYIDDTLNPQDKIRVFCPEGWISLEGENLLVKSVQLRANPFSQGQNKGFLSGGLGLS
jgi:hypothetical protein